ncbi:MAG: ArsB/NhaD family transporter [Micrococcales bacterium]
MLSTVAMFAIAIFLIAYVLIATEKFNRVAIVSAGAAAMVLIGAANSETAFFSEETGIDWNVIFLLLGMMIIVSVIHKTGLFEYLAVRSIQFVGGRPKAAFVAIMLLVAVASALLDNVTTILLAVPMIFLVSKYLDVKPMPFILGAVFVSNIGGAATLIGDPPNIIIGSKAGLSFNDFLIHMAPMAALVLLVVLPLLVFMFRKDLANGPEDRAKVRSLVPSSYISDRTLLIKSVSVLALVIAAFVLHSIVHIEPALVAMMGAGLLVLISNLKPKDFAMDVEWGTLTFFAGLFVMVGALVHVGAMGAFADFLAGVVGTDASFAGMVILWVSALLSGVVDNIPYVASMVPVVAQLKEALHPIDDSMWWALAAGADFGGNLTMVGASANVVAIGLAAAKGYKISFAKFAAYGVPVTLVSVAVATPYLLFFHF